MTAEIAPIERYLGSSELQEAFPEVEPGARPLGARILVQLRTVSKKSKGGLILVEETKETEQYNTQVARVIRTGPIAFRNRETGKEWPEGTWAKPGDFVRVPRWGGDRWSVPINDKGETALFCMFNDHEIIAEITGNPLEFAVYIK